MRLLTIRLSAIDESNFIVSAKLLNAGEAEDKSTLPFFEPKTNWRTTLINILEVSAFSDKFSEEQRTWMKEKGLLMSDGSGFSADYLEKIGQELYNSLFPIGNVRALLQRSIALAEQDSNPQLHIQIEFNAEVPKLNRLPDYPWEMVHDGQRFLAHHNVTFSRYIAHLAASPTLLPVSPINVLLVSSGACDRENEFAPLSKKEHEAVKKGLEKSQEEGHIRIREPKQASFKELETYLTKHRGDDAPHVLHFDGHGAFGKRCRNDECRTFHRKLSLEKCTKCQTALPSSQGYLLFEPDEGDDDELEANYVSSEELGSLLQSIRHGDTEAQQGGLRLAVLSACKSAYALGGNSVFNGVAQSLIGHGVPAAVAMQYTVSVKSAIAFAERFYRELGNKQSLAVATSQGRAAMQNVQHNQWYRLIFYLRWRDNEGGQLFAQNQQIAQDERIQIAIPDNLPDNSLSMIKFVGRDTNIEEIDKQFQNTSRVVITGLGGVGKTTLADQYARKSREKKAYPGGIWLIDVQEKSVSDIEIELSRCFRNLLSDLAAPDDTVQDKLIFYRQHLKALTDKRRVLLILDSITEENYNQINKYLSDSQNFKLLMIAPKPFGLKPMRLDVLERQASIEFLAAYAEDKVKKDKEKAGDICQQLEDIPLGLEYAGKILKEQEIEEFHNKLQKVSKDRIAESSRIFSAFDVNWNHLDIETQTFAYLLSLFASAPISFNLIKILGEKFEETPVLREICPNLYINGAQNILIQSNLLKATSNTFGQCHQFVQNFLKKKLEQLSKEDKCKAENLKRIFYQVMVEEARKILPNPTQQELENVELSIPHLSKIGREMQEDLKDKELVDLFTGLGRYYEGNGHYTEATKQYKDCLKVLEKRLGKQHPYIFKIQNALAHIYLLSKDYKKAESLYKEALKGDEQWLKENSPDGSERRKIYLNIATSKDDLGYLYLCLYLRDKFCSEAKLFLDKAEPFLKEALEIREKLFAEENPNAEHQDDIPRNLDHLAMFHRLQKQWEKAEEYYKKALEIRTKEQQEYPILAESYHNSATNYFDRAIFYNSKEENRDNEQAKQNYKKAKESYLKALEIVKQIHGKTNIKVAITLYELAKTCVYLREYDKAIESYKEALNIKKTIWGKHLDVAENMKRLADCSLIRESYKDAMDWFNQALDFIKNLDKSKDLEGQRRLIEEICVQLNDLRERYTDAESLFNRALILYEGLPLSQNPCHQRGFAHQLWRCNRNQNQRTGLGDRSLTFFSCTYPS